MSVIVLYNEMWGRGEGIKSAYLFIHTAYSRSSWSTAICTKNQTIAFKVIILNRNIPVESLSRRLEGILTLRYLTSTSTQASLNCGSSDLRPEFWHILQYKTIIVKIVLHTRSIFYVYCLRLPVSRTTVISV